MDVWDISIGMEQRIEWKSMYCLGRIKEEV